MCFRYPTCAESPHALTTDIGFAILREVQTLEVAFAHSAHWQALLRSPKVDVKTAEEGLSLLSSMSTGEDFATTQTTISTSLDALAETASLANLALNADGGRSRSGLPGPSLLPVAELDRWLETDRWLHSISFALFNKNFKAEQFSRWCECDDLRGNPS